MFAQFGKYFLLFHLLPRFSSVKIVFLLCNSVRMIYSYSGFWISSWVQGSFHQKSLSACYSIFIMILIVLNHHKILWISRHSLPLFLTITNHWNNQNGGNSFQSNSKFSNSIINGKVKLHQWFLVFMSSFVNGSKIMLKYVNCYVMNHQRFNFTVFLLVVTELNII